MYKDSKIWKLWTILEEEGNCHFYEKCGFTKTGEEQKIKDDMNLVEYEKIFE